MRDRIGPAVKAVLWHSSKPATIKQSWFQINHPAEYLDTASLIVQLWDDQNISSDWKLVKNETKKIEICSHHNQNCHFLILMPQRSNRIEKREIEITDNAKTNFVLLSISVSHLMYNNGVSTEHGDRVHLQQQRQLVLASVLLCSITRHTPPGTV